MSLAPGTRLGDYEVSRALAAGGMGEVYLARTLRSNRRRSRLARQAQVGDGRTLYFISRRAGSNFNLWAVRFDPDRGIPVGDPFSLTAFDAPSLAHLTGRAAGRDGRILAACCATMKAVSGSIWMLDSVDR
jgi:hypothetical protein